LITERRVRELIPVFGSQPAGDVSHKPGGRLPLLSARPAVTPASLKRDATNFAAWWQTTAEQTAETNNSKRIGNEIVPKQLAQCWFPGLGISNAKI